MIAVDRLQALLQCPDCGGSMTFAVPLESSCDACGFRGGPRDFMPRRPRPAVLHLQKQVDLDARFKSIRFGVPELTYDGPRPPRECRDVLSVLDKSGSATPRNLALDIGCGDGGTAAPLESLGFEWVGIDFPGEGPTLFADAHALPFRNGSFDLVFSLVMLEHVQNPFIVAAEAARVLKPGGLCVGVVAFGEPFHDSFLHASAWGIVSILSSADLGVERLWSCRDTLLALADMGGYPAIVRWLLRGVASFSRFPPLSPRRWLRGGATSQDLLITSGSIAFSARKAEEASA